MSHKIEHIRFLVTKEILNTLTEQELQELSAELEKNSFAKEMRDEMLNSTNSNDFLQYLHSSSSIDTAEILIRNIRRHRTKRVILISSATAVAAAILFLIISPFLLRNTSDKSTGDQFNAINTFSKNKIQLSLPNGQILDLGHDTTQMAGNLHIKSLNKKLSYSTEKSNLLAYATLHVPVGKDYTISLPDGTEVQLNAESSIRFPIEYYGNTREVFIKGEAYLKVEHDTKPFMVHLPNQTVQVLGTEFNVNTYDSLITKVSLVEGKVKIVGKTGSVELKPGEEGALSKEKMGISQFDEIETLSWRLGLYHFNNAPLNEVCKVVSRWFAVKLIVDNQTLLSRRFTGKIDKNLPLGNLLRGLKSTNGIDYYRDTNGDYHIK